MDKNKILQAVNDLNKVLPLVERQKNLDSESKKVYRLILDSYIKRGRTLNKSEITGLVDNSEAVIYALHKNGLVVFDKNNEPVGAYPFTMEQRDFKVKVNGYIVHAMCALDALAISPMFNIKTCISASCVVSGDSLYIEQLDQTVLTREKNKNIYFGINWNAANGSCCASSLCMEMVFLKNREVAHSWSLGNKNNRQLFSIDEAIYFASRFFTPLIKNPA